MKLGEKLVFGFAMVVTVAAVAKGVMQLRTTDPAMPRDYYEFSDAGVRGHALYRQLGCNSCHRAMGVGEVGVAPVLDGEGTRRSLAWIDHYFEDPRALVPATAHDGSLGPDLRRMPAADRRLLAAFLFGLKANPGSPNYPSPPAAVTKDAR